MRKPIIAANWKMNKNLDESVTLIQEILKMNLDPEVEAVLCVPFTTLAIARDLLKDTKIALGAQNMYYEESGAYTGEISPLMLNNLGVDYVILGHSERREIFGEDDALINKKVKAALSHKIAPILCCGETLEEREEGKAFDKVEGQVEKGLQGISAEEMASVVIAYEPIWAIGTGKTASSDDAEEMLAFIRQLLAKKYGDDVSKATRIQYGGSVKPGNVAELMAKENIDGALVGGASLEADSYSALVNYRGIHE